MMLPPVILRRIISLVLILVVILIIVELPEGWKIYLAGIASALKQFSFFNEGNNIFVENPASFLQQAIQRHHILRKRISDLL